MVSGKRLFVLVGMGLCVVVCMATSVRACDMPRRRHVVSHELKAAGAAPVVANKSSLERVGLITGGVASGFLGGLMNWGATIIAFGFSTVALPLGIGVGGVALGMFGGYLVYKGVT